jgi:hypothetical protein
MKINARFLRVLVIALAAAFIGPLLDLGFYSGAIEYAQPTDPATFHAMSYEEQQKWLVANSRNVGGFELIQSRLADRNFYPEYFRAALIYFLVVTGASAALLKWESTKNAL